MTAPRGISDDTPAPAAIPARPEHLESLLDCHTAALPGDVITLLGRAFLRRHYRFYMTHPEGICLVTLDEPGNRVTGFVVGGDPRLRRRFVLRHLPSFVWTVLVRSAVNARVRRRFTGILGGALRRLVGKLRRPGATAGEQPAIPAEPAGTWAVLLTIGTHPDFRRRGAGRKLLRAFHAEAARCGFEAMRVMTRIDNEASNGLYRRTGWELVGSAGRFQHYRRPTEEQQ